MPYLGNQAISMNKKKKTLLWKIETKGIAEPSYLFGTMHVRDQRAFYYKELVESKILECEAFAAEMNLEEIDQAAMANSMDLPDGQTLRLLLKPKNYKKIDKLFQSQMGIPLSHFDTSQPLLITNILTERLLNAEMPLSLDATLQQFARQNEKITLGIETFDEQLEILSKISLEYQLKSLIWIAKNFKRFRKQLLKMTDLYATADIQRLFQSAKKNAKGMRKALLYDRNTIMAERISKMAKEQSIFVAIGAGHLGGKKGVLRLLKLKGLKIKPVPLKSE